MTHTNTGKHIPRHMINNIKISIIHEQTTDNNETLMKKPKIHEFCSEVGTFFLSTIEEQTLLDHIKANVYSKI